MRFIVNQPFSRIPIQSFPITAFGTTFAGMLSALLTAWCYGLGDQYGWDILGFVLGTIAVVDSLVVVAWMCSSFLPWPLIFLIAWPVGALHGLVWAGLVGSGLQPVLANFTVPLHIPWIIGSIGGLVGAALVQPFRPYSITTHPITLISLSALLIAFFGPGLVLASCLLALLLDDGVVEEATRSPDRRVTALVIGDDCGATCSCSLRVDLKTDQRYVREVYRSDACAAWVTWQDQTHFRIEDDDGGDQQVDLHTFGLAP